MLGISATVAGEPLALPTQALDPELRLATVGYRLAQSNPDRCDGPVMLTGFMPHNIGDYGARDRAAAQTMYGFNLGFGVLHVVQGSVADYAGLIAGDEIVAVNETDLSGFALNAIRNTSNFERTEKFVDFLSNALVRGPAVLTVRRNAVTMEIRLAGQPGCGNRFAMISQGAADAWSDGRYVAVTRTMIELAGDDSELAFVVAHEMAHNFAHDADRKSPLGGLLLEFGLGAARIKKSEIAADNVAISLMARAGYDLTAPERLLRKSASSHSLDLATTHPGVSRRISNARAAVAKLENARISSGQNWSAATTRAYGAAATTR